MLLFCLGKDCVLRWFLLLFYFRFVFVAGLGILAFSFGYLFRFALVGALFLAFFVFCIAFASIIGLIESGAFEYHPRSGTD